MKLLRAALCLLTFTALIEPALADSASNTNVSVGPVGQTPPGFATYHGMLLNGGTMAGAGGSQWGTAPTGMNVLGTNANVLSLPSLPNGSNTIGSIANTGFNVTGSLPAFASTPAFNLLQQNGVNLASPTAWGSAPSGGSIVPNVNANIVAGSVSASFSGYSPAAYGSTMNVTSASSRQVLPAGTTVVVYNTGTNNAYVTIGNSSVVAALNNDVVFPNCWITYSVGSSVDIAAITSASTTTLNLSGGSGLPAGGCAAVLTGASTVTANQGTATGGTPWPVSVSSLPALAAGSNTIGAISNTGFNVTGSLPAFATTPTFNLGTLNGAATAANQNVTGAGVSSANAQGVQGVTGGVPMPISAAAAGLPLPTGAATSALQTTINTTLGSPMQNSGGSVTANLGTIGTAATAANQTTGNTTLGSILTALGTPMQNTGGTVTANLGTLNGAATAVNQEVTAAGTSASNAQGVQGVTNGVPFPTQGAPNKTSTGNITTVDTNQTCTSTNWGNQSACTGTPIAGSAVQVAVSSAGYLWAQGITTGGTATVNFAIRISNDGGTTWFNRGIFAVTNPAPFQINNIVNQNFAGWLTGGVTNVEVIATTYTVLTGTPTTAITITQGQATPFVTSSATSSAANGSGSSAATNIQGNGTSAAPVNTNMQQVANTALAAPTAWGSAPTGGSIVQNVNANIVAGSVSASFSQFAPNGNYAQLSVGASSTRVALPTGVTVAVYNTGTFPAFVQLGSGSVVATTSNDVVPPGGGICLGVGSNTNIAGIETAGTTSLNISGGSGGCAGFGGGSAASSGGAADANLVFSGTISTANIFGTGMSVVNYMSSGGLIGYVDGGAELTGTCTTNSCMSTSGFAGWNSVYLECSASDTTVYDNWFEVDVSGGTGGTIQKRQATFTGGTFSGIINVAGATFLNVMADKYTSGTITCTARATQNFGVANKGNGPVAGNFTTLFTANSSATARIITGVPGLSIMPTAVQAWTDGSSSAAQSAQIVAGTGSNCGTNQVILSEPMNFPAGSGVVTATTSQLVTAPPGDDICLTSVATSSNKVYGSLVTSLR